MNRDEMIERLQESLDGCVSADETIELTGKERVKLLETLLRDFRDEQKLELDRAKLDYLMERDRMLHENPLLPSGPAGLGQRLIEHDPGPAKQPESD